jgi:hypothetical protein
MQSDILKNIYRLFSLYIYILVISAFTIIDLLSFFRVNE